MHSKKPVGRSGSTAPFILNFDTECSSSRFREKKTMLPQLLIDQEVILNYLLNYSIEQSPS